MFFKDRAFNFSILISSAWHLFWIAAIGIVVTPSVIPSSAHPEIGFLGPILEKTAFDLMAEEVTPHSEIGYARSTLFLDKVCLKPRGPGRKVLKEFTPGAAIEELNFSLRDYVKDTKEIPRYMVGYMKSTHPDLQETSFRPSMEGPAAKIEIIFRPEFLTVPRGIYGDPEEYAVKLKFLVSTSGLVYDVEPVISSGYPEIDMQATKFLKKWRFLPQGPGGAIRPTWGAVAVKVIAK